MFQYRAVLGRLRQGDSDRDVARARLMGRPKVAALRALAAREGWLAPDTALPEDGAIAAVIGQARRARSTVSTVEPFRRIVARWAEQGISEVAIHVQFAPGEAALVPISAPAPSCSMPHVRKCAALGAS